MDMYIFDLTHPMYQYIKMCYTPPPPRCILKVSTAEAPLSPLYGCLRYTLFIVVEILIVATFLLVILVTIVRIVLIHWG